MEENQNKGPQGTGPQDGGSYTGNASQNTAGPAGGVQPCAAVIPWYKTPVFWISLVLFLGLLVLMGLLMHQKYLAEQAAARSQYDSLLALKAKNDAAEQYLAQLEHLLELDPCAVVAAMQGIVPPEGYALPALVVPGTAPSQGQQAAPVTPANPAAPAAPDTPAAPAAPEAQNAQGASTQDKADQAPAQSAALPGSVAEKLEQATVLILGAKNGGTSMGSGFFITPSHIMTNAHVVKGCTSVFFTNKKLGAVQKARIAMFTEKNGQDFAVLHTASPCDITPLVLLDDLVSRTQKVSAWGFPGAVTDDDPKLNALFNGDKTAAPEVVYSDGTVNVIQDGVPPLIVHSATVSQGNSGGPLVDEQGRVVGINTFIKMDKQSYRQSSLSIPSTTICKFLTENGIPYTQAKKADSK